MKAALIWLATLTIALLEIAIFAAIGACFGAALAIMLLYAATYGGIR